MDRPPFNPNGMIYASYWTADEWFMNQPGYGDMAKYASQEVCEAACIEDTKRMHERGFQQWVGRWCIYTQEYYQIYPVDPISTLAHFCKVVAYIATQKQNPKWAWAYKDIEWKEN